MTESITFKDVKIFDGETTIPKGHLIVDAQGLIQSLGPGDPPAASGNDDGTTISKPGHTLLPGLIDAHIHADNGNAIALPQSLRFGVTTVCDMGNEPPYVSKLLDQIAHEGDGVCADLKTAQYAATIDGGWPMAVVLAHDKSEATLAQLAKWPKLATPADVPPYVASMRAQRGGLDYVKLMHESGAAMGMPLPMPPVELQRALVDEAHRCGLKAVAHATCLADTLEVLGAGVDGTTHVMYDQAPTPQLVEAYKRNNAHCNPTLAAVGSLTTEGLDMQRRYAADPRVSRLLTDPSRESMHCCMGFSQGRAGATAENAYESVRQLHAAGVEIICGSDAAGPARGTAWGLSVHQELALFVERCGFTPAQALRSATLAPAKCLNFHDRGTLAAGKRADLLLVEGDPTADVDHLLNIRGVWKKGVPAVAHPLE